MHLTLVIPELIWHEPGELDAGTHRTPSLNRLLAWGSLTRSPHQAVEHVLADALGDARAKPAATIGLASARGLGETVPVHATADEHLLCADPIHLHFHRDRMLVADASVNPPNEADAAALIDALNTQFAGTLRLLAAAPTRWYALLPKATVAALGPLPAPLSTVAGHQLPADGFGRTPALRQLASELQMALHAQPLTRTETDAGRQAINAVWLWGGHAAVAPAPTRDVACAEPLARGLARALGHRVHDDAASALPLLNDVVAATPLAVLDALDAPGRYQDRDAYTAQLATLESNWFAPIESALRAGALRQLTLVVTGAYGVLRWQITPPGLWARRPWAPPPPDLAARARDLARARPT